MQQPKSPSSKSHLMAEVYSEGPMAHVVAAASAPGFMNLGFAEPRDVRIRPARRQLNLVRKVLDLLDPRPGESILDVGCGTGGALALLVASLPLAKAVGLNVDPRQLAAARRLLDRTDAGRSAGLVLGDAVRMPFQPASFEGVYAIEVTAHVREKAALVSEINRILKPKGRVALAYITLNKPLYAFRPDDKEYLKRVASFFNENPEDYLTRTDYELLFEGQGLLLRESLDLTDGVYPHRHTDLLTALARFNGRSLWQRLLRFYYHRLLWKTDDVLFRRFLEVNTERHLCRYFEYHLAVWEKG